MKHRDVLKSLIQQAQGLLIWLVERQRGSPCAEPALFATRASASSSPWTTLLHEKCLSSSQTWVEHLQFLLNGYIGYTKALMELEAKLEEGQSPNGTNTKLKALLVGDQVQEANQNDEEDIDLVPLKVAKSLSLPISRQPHQGVRLSPSETSI